MQAVTEDDQAPGNAVVAHHEGADPFPSHIELSGVKTELFH